MTRKISRVVIKKNEFAKLAKLAPREVDKALKALSQEGETIVKGLWENSPADGRTYTRGNKTHTASSPGNPSRVDSGTLINSTHAEKVKKGEHRIVSESEHAVYQEFGVPENGLEARPAHGPMALELEGLIPDFFDGLLEDKV